MTSYPKENIVNLSQLTWLNIGLDPQKTDLPKSKEITSFIGGYLVYGKVGLRTSGTPRVSETTRLVILYSLPLIQEVK